MQLNSILHQAGKLKNYNKKQIVKTKILILNSQKPKSQVDLEICLKGTLA
jgi:hypothetical protein